MSATAPIGKVSPKPKWTRAQKSTLASCYWQPCPGCDEKVPILRGVGIAASGFKSLHKSTCGKAS